MPISDPRQTQIWPLRDITAPSKFNTKHANWTSLITSFHRHHWLLWLLWQDWIQIHSALVVHLRPRTDWNVGDLSIHRFHVRNQLKSSSPYTSPVVHATSSSSCLAKLQLSTSYRPMLRSVETRWVAHSWNMTRRSAMSRVIAPRFWIITSGFPSSTEIRFGILTDNVHAISPPSRLTIHTTTASHRPVLVVRQYTLKSRFCAVSHRFWTFYNSTWLIENWTGDNSRVKVSFKYECGIASGK